LPPIFLLPLPFLPYDAFADIFALIFFSRVQHAAFRHASFFCFFADTP